MTGDCGEQHTKGYTVYKDLASHSNSQIFHIESAGIEKVLLALRYTMKNSYVPFRQIESAPAISFMPFSVDFTIYNIGIRLSGKGAKMTIKNPLNQTVTGDATILDELQIVNFENPMTGTWTVEAESSSEYTIQIGTNSNLNIEYGFSSGVPQNHAKTSVQPKKGDKNILTFFVSDPSKIRNLSYANLLLENTSKLTRTRRDIKVEKKIQLTLRKISDYVYATEPFHVPVEIFKVQINGIDLHGNEIQRIVSSAVESIEPSKLYEMS